MESGTDGKEEEKKNNSSEASPVTDFWEEGSGGELVIKQTLLVPKENHVKLIIGPGGELISRIAKEAGCDLMNAFLCDVRLRIAVKYRKK